jgi:hypothetical protein
MKRPEHFPFGIFHFSFFISHAAILDLTLSGMTKCQIESAKRKMPNGKCQNALGF